MINKVILLGNLGAAPETKYTKNGSPVVTFNIATSERWKGKDGQQQELTEWHRIVTFNRLAEICEKYLFKGSKVYIEGRLQTRPWDDKDGYKRYSTEIVAREMKMLDSKGTSQSRDNEKPGQLSRYPELPKDPNTGEDIF